MSDNQDNMWFRFIDGDTVTPQFSGEFEFTDEHLANKKLFMKMMEEIWDITYETSPVPVAITNFNLMTSINDGVLEVSTRGEFILLKED